MIRLKTLEKSLSWLEKWSFQFLFVAQKRRLLKLSTVDWQVLPQFINTLLLRFHENFITKIIKIFIKIWLKPYSWWTYRDLSFLSPLKYSVDTSFIPVLPRSLREKSKQNRASKYVRNTWNWHGYSKEQFSRLCGFKLVKCRTRPLYRSEIKREREREKNEIYTHKVPLSWILWSIPEKV